MKITAKDILYYLLILFLCVSFIVLMFLASQKLVKNTLTNTTGYMPTVIIDAGHGGEDGGSSSPDGKIIEKDLNLIIAKDLEAMLKVAGFNTLMIRTEDISIHDSDKDTIRSKKISDLKNRLNIINSNKNCVVISIHQNSFPQSQIYGGSQMFYSSRNNKSADLANSVKNSVVKFLQPQNKRQIKPVSKSVFLIYNSQNPTLLIECGFLSNPEDLKLLCDEDYQKKLAFAIFGGFVDYWRGVDHI